jgi:hypothetical protein
MAEHIFHDETPEEAARIDAIDDIEASPAGRQAAAEGFRKLRAACVGDGFAAVLRRAISAEIRRRDVTVHKFAADAGIDLLALEAFRRGEGTLPSDVIERLVEVVGLQVVAH